MGEGHAEGGFHGARLEEFGLESARRRAFVVGGRTSWNGLCPSTNASLTAADPCVMRRGREVGVRNAIIVEVIVLLWVTIDG